MQVAFLYDGRFLSVAQRISGLEMSHEQPNAPHEVSFEYLNQQLVWGELQNFVVFLLPLLTPRALAASPLLTSAMGKFAQLRRWQGAHQLSCWASACRVMWVCAPSVPCLLRAFDRYLRVC